MKLSFAPLLACLVTSAAASSLRSGSVGGDCSTAATKDACQASTDDQSHEPCVWCEARAVKSACFTKEQSEQLPSAVFHCDAEEDSPTPFASDEALGLTRTSFNFLQHDTTHHLLHKVHQPGNNAICDGSSKSISGYMDIKGSKYDEDNDKHLFFWMFEKRPSKENEEEESDAEIPFVVWLTGGPGCSSTLALLTENGPCSVNPDAEGTTPNPYSWTEAAHVLWLDQPAGVGFSYGEENDSNEAMISEDAYYFLQAFFQTYPEYARKDPFLFIVGESYGGEMETILPKDVVLLYGCGFFLIV
jgi:carboxypeptidase C (cathepsin A)